jgi:hypothetical protein
MKRKKINPKEASVAATYYVPAYQRLRQWHRGEAIDLLCFVNHPSDKVKQLLGDVSAFPSKEFRADCFAEVWQVPHETLLNSRLAASPDDLDKQISEALGCGDGKYSADAGLVTWGDHREEEQSRRHVASQLLLESSAKRGRLR